MKNHLWEVMIGTIITAFVAFSAMAAPPFYKSQNRVYGNSAGATHCDYADNGYRCVSVYAFEDYDVKGNYEFTRASTSTDFYRFDPSDGSWSYGWRYLSCPIEKTALSPLGNKMVLETTIDPTAAGCDSWGFIETCDASYVCESTNWQYEESVYVAGWWMDPADHSTATVKLHGSSYDPWSDTTTNFVQQCKQTYGYAMRDGLFFINDDIFRFEGPGGSVWSDFQITSCNENSRQ